MPPWIRRVFPYAVLASGLAAVAWAAFFGTLPPADFTFSNGDEVQTVDPAKATGQPENRVLNGLFEGLLTNMPTTDQPDEQRLVPMEPQPAVAESLPEISEDGRVYTFKLRPSARWSENNGLGGRPVTADDFVWSWRRTLHPDTASKYAYQLSTYLENADKYNTGLVEEGDRVEVELADRPDPIQPFPRGTIVRGTLRRIVRPPAPAADPAETLEQRETQWRRRWTYVVEIKPVLPDAGQGGRVETHESPVDWAAEGNLRAFSQDPEQAEQPGAEFGSLGAIQPCVHVLLDFGQVGVRAEDERTLIVTLRNRTPYFNSLAAFYTLFPVHRECVEKYGTPRWTKPENIVSNGPFQLQFRRIRDRIRMVKNPHYWNADQVALNVIDVLAVKSHTTGLSMYLEGQLDWASNVPKLMIPELLPRDDFITAPALITYFYRVNVTRPPLDNVLVRRALNLAIDKRQICERVTKAGERPASSLVPPGMAGYEAALCGQFDIAEARRLLAEAGYPGGRGLPKVEILYNTDDNHRAIAEVIGQMWKEHLGIDVELKNVEWGNYLDRQRELDYSVSRAGWIGDYPDPNTFLDMFVTGGGQNQTGWSHPGYDALIAQAAAEPDPEQRMRQLHEAERILMDELPILPIYYYVSINMVKPYVRGFSANILDTHPLHILRLDGNAASASLPAEAASPSEPASPAEPPSSFVPAVPAETDTP
ncbi:MAG: peptide ABC transporter substrate-binding protein [Pirellulaceae bacterium]|nr:peptide ABC transporter substrate-binding protein [Pirellulaceae bacterium]